LVNSTYGLKLVIENTRESDTAKARNQGSDSYHKIKMQLRIKIQLYKYIKFNKKNNFLAKKNKKALPETAGLFSRLSVFAVLIHR